jgi:hypothetical protein
MRRIIGRRSGPFGPSKGGLAMHVRSLLAVAALGSAVAFAGLAATTSAASAATVEGKIASVGIDEQTVTIKKKAYRLSEGAKVLVSGKPASFDDLKPGMTCEMNVAYRTEAKSLSCSKKDLPVEPARK